MLDRRVNLYRDDLADYALKGKVTATHFAIPKLYQLISDELPLYATPDYKAIDAGQGRTTTLIFGERVKILEIQEGWAFLQNCRDDYVGYAFISSGFAHNTIKPCQAPPTHYIKSGNCFAYQAKSIKAEICHNLSFTALIDVIAQEDEWCKIQIHTQRQAPATYAYIEAKHLAPIKSTQTDLNILAQSCLNFPYLWGGGSFMGYDCSQLLQQMFWAHGVKLPRDSDMQMKIGREIKDAEPLKLGDLVFWQGHVAMMLNESQMLHANARDMRVAIWELDDAISRFKQILNLDLLSKRRILTHD